MLPIAMLCGILFHNAIKVLQPAVPYLIFTMLLITFCRVRPTDLRLTPQIGKLLAIQIFGSVALFIALKPLGLPLAQGVMICVLCPTATAAPVVTGMLGGSIARVAAYSIVSNLAVAIIAPALFVWVGSADSGMTFFEAFAAIGMKVAPLIVIPMLCAFALYLWAPKVHSRIAQVQSISFYLWACSLLIVVGRSVSFVMEEPADAIPMELAISGGALAVCLLQFWAGRTIGARYGDKISAAQGLMQKNTVLAIWMALTYFEPISSVGPAAYILWQNTINSGQIYLKTKHGKQ